MKFSNRAVVESGRRKRSALRAGIYKEATRPWNLLIKGGVESGRPNMNKGTAPPLGRGGCGLNKMVPFLSAADGEGRRHFKLAPCLTSPAAPRFR